MYLRSLSSTLYLVSSVDHGTQNLARDSFRPLIDKRLTPLFGLTLCLLPSRLHVQAQSHPQTNHAHPRTEPVVQAANACR
jgi:hypothetical protein